jgi:hypothetical protein
MNIIASFTDNGVPKTGLSPTINIREVPTGVLVISGSNMMELGDGSYYYDYVNYDFEKNYSIRCDGGSDLAYTERYTFAGNENYIDDVENMFDTNTTLLGIKTELTRVLGLVQENYYLDQMVYSTYQGAQLLTSGRIRIYNDAVSIGTDSNIIAIYNITANWIDDKLQTYKVVKQ